MALLSQNHIFLWVFSLVLDAGDSIVVWYNIQLNRTACKPYFLLDIMFDRKYFQKSHRNVLMMSERNKASQYKWSFHLSDAKTFWKMYTSTQFSQKSYLCCGHYLIFSRAVKQLCSLNGKKKTWNLTFSPGFVQFGGIWLVQKANHMTWNEILWEFMLWTPPFCDQKLRTPRS